MDTIIQILARELGQKETYIQNVVNLIDEGNTIPFIARYRKELHGAMDDTTLRTLADRLQYLRNLDKRREEVKGAIEAQGKLTEELSAAIDSAATLAEVEDLYRPYKQKRRTRATMAKEKGLEPLADLLFAQAMDGPVPEEAAAGYVDPEKGVETVEDALQGANDIIAERISDDADIRKLLRELVWKKGYLVSAAAAKEVIDGMLQDFFQDPDAYYTQTMEEQANLINAMMGVVMGVLVAIAAISLLVGGIGIMNIMLVSITERTREIGIRKSLGAKRRDIRSQFVIEAGTTSAIGGLLGIALGCLLAMGVGSLIGAMLTSQMGGGATFSATPTLGAVAISFGVSVGIGVLFGYLPANKAAKLNPIDALRYD